MAEKKRKQKCSTKGCRKAAIRDGLCEKHASNGEQTAYPIDGVVRVTELEAAQYAAKDAEIRNTLLSIKNQELEIEKAERAFTDAAIRHKAEQDRRRAQYELLKKGAETQKVSYIAYVTDLSKKYSIDPQKMSIDPDTRVIRDLTEGNQS